MMVMEKKKTLKRCSSMSLAENIAEYEDILIEILVRLPARPLSRFKCVSKRWLFLISDPDLCHRHTLHNPRPSISAYFIAKSSELCFSILHCGNQKPLRASERSCCPLNSEIKIVQSCNGLFLCRPQPPNDGFHTSATSLIYYVLNPTTNKFRALTPPAAAAATTVHPRIFGYALAFDPSKSPHYKVIFLWFADEPSRGYAWWAPKYRIEIYSSKTRSWDLLGSCFINHHSFISYFGGVYCNGAVHWAGMDCEVFYYHIDEKRVGHVDGLPNNYGRHFGSVKSRYFRESHGGTHLHLIDIPWDLVMNLQVKEMGKDYSGWSVKYNVDLNPVYTAYPQLVKEHLVVLSLAAQENKDSSSMLLHYPGGVIYYNLSNNTVKSAQVIPNSGLHYDPNFHYVESLAVV